MRKSISNLSGYCNLIIGLIAHWALVFVTVVKGDGNSGFGDTGLSTFVDQLLQIAGTHLSTQEYILQAAIFTKIMDTLVGCCITILLSIMPIL